MPRNPFNFNKEKSYEENFEDYKKFTKQYVQERVNSNQFVNCKIYGNITNGEVYTTWLYANLPNKRALELSGAIVEIAPTKQGFPCCVLSRELKKPKTTTELGMINIDVKYEFRMLKFTEKQDILIVCDKGWKIRKWFDSLQIFTIEDVANKKNFFKETPEW